MKNYEEKEKKLDNILKKLNTMSNKVGKMSNDINSLSLEKNQLLREKEESDKNYQDLSEQHEELKSELEKINKDVSNKFGSNNNCFINLGIKIAMKFGGINIDKGTQTLLYLLERNLQVTGEYFYKNKISPSSNFSLSKINADKLWDESLKIVSDYL